MPTCFRRLRRGDALLLHLRVYDIDAYCLYLCDYVFQTSATITF